MERSNKSIVDVLVIEIRIPVYPERFLTSIGKRFSKENKDFGGMILGIVMLDLRVERFSCFNTIPDHLSLLFRIPF